MDPKLQRRVQRYGWDKAADLYEAGWRTQLEPAQDRMLDMAALKPGERVLDVACGTGIVSFRAAQKVGEEGAVIGTDISGEMVETARAIATERGIANASFERRDAEQQTFDPDSFDAALCALGLMYVPEPVVALTQMHSVLRPGGRISVAVWGARAKCGWAEVFPITDAQVKSEVCPMFFHLGTKDMLAVVLEQAGFADIRLERIETDLNYDSDDAALSATFRGGPVALAYSRFDDRTRQTVHEEYLGSIKTYKSGAGYRILGEFVAAAGTKPAT